MTKANHVIIAAIILLMLQGLILYLFLSRGFVCPCGNLKLWSGVRRGPENSQHMLDWYSLAHVMYGMALAFLVLLARKYFNIAFPFYIILLIAVATSASWEIFENTYYTIEKYQQDILYFDYYGDSIFNSIMDTIAVAAGFLLAFYLPWKFSLALFVIMEIALILTIRDSLLIRTALMIHPIEFIKQWQAALVNSFR